MNPAKSDFGETTVTYEQLASGEMRGTVDGESFTFKMDEKDYPALFGYTVAWKSLTPTSWQSTAKLKGKVMSTDVLTLSPDGKSLTVTSKGTKPNGEPLDNTVVMDRVSGESGLVGKWKTKNLSTSSPSSIEFVPSGEDGLTIRVVDMGLTCAGKIDGKDYPCTGPTLGEGWTVAFASTDPRSLGMTVKNNGKQLYQVLYTASADGKTLIETGGSTKTNEKVKIVYDRQ